jgi:hypothetical protein
MRQLLFFLCAAFFAIQIHAQTTIALQRQEVTIHPDVTKETKETPKLIQLTIQLNGSAPGVAAPATGIDIPVTINSVRPCSVNPQLISGTIHILTSDWSPAGGTATVTKSIGIKTSSVSSFDNEEVFYITLGTYAGGGVSTTNGATNNIEVRITTKGVYDLNKPFWVEIGANFDLIDGLAPNNFFTGVFFYKRDINRSVGSNCKKLALFAGVFESKSTTSLSEEKFSLRYFYDSTSIMPNKPDSLKVYKSIGNDVVKKTVRNVGLFFSPQVRLTNGNANEDGLHLFASLWTELQWQRIREEQNFNQIKVMKDTMVLLNDALSSNRFNLKNGVKETDLRTHYFGLGFPIFFRETVSNDVVQLFMNPVLGFTNQPSSQFLKEMQAYEFERLKNGTLEQPYRKWEPFYLIQFRLNEEAYGFAFTGEVRGLVKRNNPPIVSFALTKKFDLTKFLEFGKR